MARLPHQTIFTGMSQARLSRSRGQKARSAWKANSTNNDELVYRGTRLARQTRLAGVPDEAECDQRGECEDDIVCSDRSRRAGAREETGGHQRRNSAAKHHSELLADRNRGKADARGKQLGKITSLG